MGLGQLGFQTPAQQAARDASPSRKKTPVGILQLFLSESFLPSLREGFVTGLLCVHNF